MTKILTPPQPAPVMHIARELLPPGMELVVADPSKPEFYDAAADAEYYLGSPRHGIGNEFFRAMGSAGASTYSPKAPHPYMQKTRTLDFCLVLEGEITLVLDTEEVHLKTGDTVIQRGTNHAWSNRSTRPCVVAISSHDATE